MKKTGDREMVLQNNTWKNFKKAWFLCDLQLFLGISLDLDVSQRWTEPFYFVIFYDN